MDDTPIFSLPFPEDSDAPNGPAQFEGLADRLEVLLKSLASGGDIYNAGATSVPNTTTTTINFTHELHDVRGEHSTGSNTDRVTVTESGFYLVTGRIQFEANVAIANAQAIITDTGNAAVILGAQMTSAASVNVATVAAVTGIIGLNAGDAFRMRAWHESGAARNVNARLAWHGLGPLAL